jgi:hypothetical protein
MPNRQFLMGRQNGLAKLPAQVSRINISIYRTLLILNGVHKLYLKNILSLFILKTLLHKPESIA